MDYKHIYKNIQPFQKIELENEDWQEKLHTGIKITQLNGEIVFLQFMNEKDIVTVYEIERKVFPIPWTRKSFFNELENRNFNLSIVAVVDSKIVGYIISYLIHDEVHICNVAVDPDFRRRQIGEIMVWGTLKICEEYNIEFAHLEVRKSNDAAIKLYKKFGFEIVGLRKNYYVRENEDALLMSLT